MTKDTINLDYINDITDGNQGMVLKLLEVLQKNLEQMPVLMRSELDNNQLSHLRKTAHKFKSSTASIGVKKLTQTLKAIELSIESNAPLEEIRKYVEQVELYVQDINNQVINKIIEIKLA